MIETKHIIADAFLDLVNKKSIDKITVKDIVENCGITRQTFYYHFQDILDVLEWILKTREEKFLEETIKAASMEDAIRIMTSNLLTQDLEIFRKLMASQKREQTERLLANTCKSYLYEMIQRKAIMKNVKASEVELTVTFYAYGLLGVFLEQAEKKYIDIDYLTRELCYLLKEK